MMEFRKEKRVRIGVSGCEWAVMGSGLGILGSVKPAYPGCRNMPVEGTRLRTWKGAGHRGQYPKTADPCGKSGMKRAGGRRG